MPMLVRKAVVTVKQETTEGVDVTPSAADNSILVTAPTVAINADSLEREILSATLSPQGYVVGKKTAQVTFTTEMRGIGAVPTALAPLRDDPLFQCCGLSPTYTGAKCSYAPKSDWTSVNSASLYVYFDGLLHKLVGCRGNLEIVMAAGQYGRFNWTISGVLGDVVDTIVDASNPVPTFQALDKIPKAVVSAGAAIGAFTACVVQQLTVNLNNEIVERPDMNSPAGVKAYFLSNRKPGGTMNPEAIDKSVFDIFGTWEAGTHVDIVASVGKTIALGGDGRIKVNVPDGQLGTPAWGDRNGIRIFDLPYTAVTGASGDDELSIDFE